MYSNYRLNVLQSILAVCFLMTLTLLRAQQSEPREVFLQSFLRELSAKTGDNFVLEKLASDKDGEKNMTAVVDFAIINAYTSPEKIIPVYYREMKVFRSPHNPRLYFVSDARLNDISNYSLLQKIPAMHYKGDERSYIKKLGENGSGIKPTELYSTGNLDRISYGTGAKIDISLQQSDLRTALSAIISVHESRGIVWVATTRIKDGKHETTVDYTRDAVFVVKK